MFKYPRCIIIIRNIKFGREKMNEIENQNITKRIWLWRWRNNGKYHYTRDIEKANEILHRYPGKIILAVLVNENGIKKFRRE